MWLLPSQLHMPLYAFAFFLVATVKSKRKMGSTSLSFLLPCSSASNYWKDFMVRILAARESRRYIESFVHSAVLEITPERE